MVNIFSTTELLEITGKNLLSVFKKFRFTREGQVIIPVPIREADKYLRLRDMIHYKYCMPIGLTQGHFILSPYSTYKFLTIVLPHLKLSKNRKLYVDDVLREHENATIKLYAAGAIEKAPDAGVGFRNACKQAFQRTKAVIISPCDFEYNKHAQCKTLAEHKERHSFSDHYKFVRKVVCGDVSEVMASDAMIVNLDQYIGVGTPAETTVCLATGKPVYGVANTGFDIQNLHPWIIGTITRFFPSLNVLRDFVIIP